MARLDKYNNNIDEVWTCPLCVELFLQKANAKYIDSLTIFTNYFYGKPPAHTKVGPVTQVNIKYRTQHWQGKRWQDLSYSDKMTFILTAEFGPSPLFINVFDEAMQKWICGQIIKVVDITSLHIYTHLCNRQDQHVPVQVKHFELLGMEQQLFHVFQKRNWDRKYWEKRCRNHCKMYQNHEFTIHKNNVVNLRLSEMMHNSINIAKDHIIQINDLTKKDDCTRVIFEQIKHSKTFWNYYVSRIKNEHNSRIYDQSWSSVNDTINSTTDQTYIANRKHHVLNNINTIDWKYSHQFNGLYLMPAIKKFSAYLFVLPHSIMPTIDAMCENNLQYDNSQPWCKIRITNVENFFDAKFDDWKLYVNEIIWVHPPYNRDDIKRVSDLFVFRRMRGYLCVPDWQFVGDYCMARIYGLSNKIIHKYHYPYIPQQMNEMFFAANIYHNVSRFKRKGINIFYIDCRQDKNTNLGKCWT